MNLTTHQSTAPKPLLRLLPAPLPDAELWFDDMCEQFRHRPMLDVFSEHLRYDLERTELMAKTNPQAYKIALSNLTDALDSFTKESEQLDADPSSAVGKYIATLTWAIQAQIEAYRHLTARAEEIL